MKRTVVWHKWQDAPARLKARQEAEARTERETSTKQATWDKRRARWAAFNKQAREGRAACHQCRRPMQGGYCKDCNLDTGQGE